MYLPVDTTAPLETDLFTVTMTNINDSRADILLADITLTYKQARVSSLSLNTSWDTGCCSLLLNLRFNSHLLAVADFSFIAGKVYTFIPIFSN